MQNPKYIVMHHSASKDGIALNTQDMRIWHLKKGWKAIAYHFIVEMVNSENEIICGRMLNEEGAHAGVTEINKNSIGICLVGNFNDYFPAEKQWVKAVKLVNYLIGQYKIQIDDVRGHRDFKPTDCPGKLFDLNKFRADVLNYKD
jgi:N-acetyl-anhydromuramyl-L-alanine amidase AmpD